MRLALLLFLSPALVLAAGTGRANCETVTISTSACPTGSPGTDADGDYFGLPLQQNRGWKVRICPITAGATITGAAGSVKFCTYSPSIWMGTAAAGWALSPQFTVPMTTSYATSSSNPCLELSQNQPVVRLSGERVYAYVSTDFAVSSGTQVKVCMSGEYESAVQ